MQYIPTKEVLKQYKHAQNTFKKLKEIHGNKKECVAIVISKVFRRCLDIVVY